MGASRRACQPVSLAGRRKGQTDERWLWPDMFRVVREVRPGWVVAENVPGLRTLGADSVLADLESEGYSCWPLVVGAENVGAPHKRHRVWIVAHSKRPGRDRIHERVESGHMEANPGRKCPDGAGGTTTEDYRLRVQGEREGRSTDEVSHSDSNSLRIGAERMPGRWTRAVQATGETLTVDDGETGDVPDPNSRGCEAKRLPGLLDGKRQERGDDTDGCDREVSYAKGVPKREQADATKPVSNEGSERVFAGCCREWQWQAEPAVGRVAHGIPRGLGVHRWMHRLHSLGNALVPQIAEVIARAILEVDR